MNIEHMSWRMFFIRIAELIFVVNIALLDIVAIQNFPHYNASLSTIQTKQIPTPTIIAPENTNPTPIRISPPIQQPVQFAGTKEAYIPLGTGQSAAADWTNVPGVLAYIDTSKYANIKQVSFEANINVPTANEIVWIQLYNMTDEHPVWNSQISMSGATQYIVSPPITLDEGNKLYQVQMKTQLQYPADLTQARIHMLLQ